MNTLELEIARLYVDEQKSAYTIADVLGISHKKVYKILEQLNIPRRSNRINSRRYTLDHGFFDVINTEEKAYWLGFLYADGYVNKYHRVGLTLSVDDISHLQKFKHAISATYPIHVYGPSKSGYSMKPYCRMVVASEQMYQSLVGKGVVPHKTDILKFPSEEVVPAGLLVPFMRGYFDGDGSIYITSSYDPKNKKRYPTAGIKLNGTIEFITEFANVLNRLLPTEKKLGFPINKRKHNDTNNYYFSVGGIRSTINVASILYNNASIYLDRKFDKFLQITNLRTHGRRKQ